VYLALRPTFAVAGCWQTGDIVMNSNTSIGPKGLGGWLILMILNQVRAFYDAGQTIFVDVRLLNRLPHGKAMNVAYAELLLVSAVLVLIVWATIALFRTKRNFPNLWKAMAVASILFAIVDTAMISLVLDVPIERVMDAEGTVQFVGLLIATCIWWLYLDKSVRVKNTFIN
jgi:hypothetical protein